MPITVDTPLRTPARPPLDTGLLAPVRTGTPVETAVSDPAWLQAMLDAEAGLAAAQARLGLIPERAAATIARAADAGAYDVAALAAAATEAANPVVAVVEALTARVAATDPEAASYVHRGSTSQDILDTAVMLVSARALTLILDDLERAAAALAALARRHRGTLMAGRTLTQHAVPTTFGLKAATWLHGVMAAQQRLAVVAAGGLPVQLGGAAAGTLAGYLEYARQDAPAAAADPGRLIDGLYSAYAAQLGLDTPLAPWHTVRTPLADLTSALTLTCGVLGKFAVDVQVLSRTEIAEVSEPAMPGRGVSSAMPQKSNPVLATLIRSAAVQVPGLSASIAHCLPAEDERPAGLWHAEWQPLRSACG